MMNEIIESLVSRKNLQRRGAENAEFAEITKTVIGAAIEVHRELGPGLLEAIYESALCLELEHRHISFVRQQAVEVKYKGTHLSHPLRLDLLVEDVIIVEIKTVEVVLPVHKAQLLSYLRLADKTTGLLINFHSAKLVDGVSRISLSSASSAPSAPLR